MLSANRKVVCMLTIRMEAKEKDKLLRTVLKSIVFMCENHYMRIVEVKLLL